MAILYLNMIEYKDNSTERGLKDNKIKMGTL